MTGEEALARMADTLQARDIPFMVVGSFTTNFYGIPRSTQDADLVVAVGPDVIAGLADELRPDIRLDPQLQFETITLTYYQRLDVAGTNFHIEIFQVSEDSHDQERFLRRRSAMYLGRSLPLPTAEDVIITKLRWANLGNRGKDRDDAMNVIAVQRNTLDWRYIYSWCDQHGTRALLDQIRTSIPP
jgi:hypothetical protein